MFLFKKPDKPEELDALVIQNWPENWIKLDICSENAQGTGDPFLMCAGTLAANAKKLKFPIMMGMTKSIKMYGDTWSGSIRVAWPASMGDVDTLKQLLFTWDVLHTQNKLGGVSFYSGGNPWTVEQALKFCNWGSEPVWRCNFKATKQSLSK